MVVGLRKNRNFYNINSKYEFDSDEKLIILNCMLLIFFTNYKWKIVHIIRLGNKIKILISTQECRYSFHFTVSNTQHNELSSNLGLLPSVNVFVFLLRVNHTSYTSCRMKLGSSKRLWKCKWCWDILMVKRFPRFAKVGKCFVLSKVEARFFEAAVLHLYSASTFAVNTIDYGIYGAIWQCLRSNTVCFRFPPDITRSLYRHEQNKPSWRWNI